MLCTLTLGCSLLVTEKSHKLWGCDTNLWRSSKMTNFCYAAVALDPFYTKSRCFSLQNKYLRDTDFCLAWENAETMHKKCSPRGDIWWRSWERVGPWVLQQTRRSARSSCWDMGALALLGFAHFYRSSTDFSSTALLNLVWKENICLFRRLKDFNPEGGSLRGQLGDLRRRP